MKINRSNLLSLAGVDSGVLATSILLGPVGTLAAIAAGSLIAFTFFSEIGFVTLVTAISHANDSFSYNFDVVRAIRWSLVALSLLVTVWQFLVRKGWKALHIGFIDKYYALFAVWGIVCLLFAADFLPSLIEYFRLLAFYVLYLVTRATVRDRKKLMIVLTLITLIVFSSSLYSVGSIFHTGYFRVRGFMNNAGAYAQVLGYLVPFVVAAAYIARARALKYLLSFVAIFGVLVLFLAWSRASIIAALVQYAVFLIAEKKYKALLVSISVAVVLAIAVLSIPTVWDIFYAVGRVQAGSTYRFTLWHTGIGAALHKPLFGYGFAVPTGDVLGRIYWNDLASNHVFHDLSRIFNVHNQYINAALSTGLPGLALFIGFLYFLIRNGIRDLLKQGRKRRRMFFTAMLSINVSLVVVCSFANGPHLASGSMANYFWITLGLTHAIRDHNIEI